MKKFIKFLNNNKHFKVIFFLLINGFASYLSKYFVETSTEFSLIFGASLNYIVWLSIRQIEKYMPAFDGHQAIDTDFDLGVDHED